MTQLRSTNGLLDSQEISELSPRNVKTETDLVVKIHATSSLVVANLIAN
jgi:hypothetical protein